MYDGGKHHKLNSCLKIKRVWLIKQTLLKLTYR